MFAIVETGGKQYKVSPGTKLKVEKLETESGGNLTLDKVLLVADGEDVKLGAEVRAAVAKLQTEVKGVQQKVKDAREAVGVAIRALAKALGEGE